MDAVRAVIELVILYLYVLLNSSYNVHVHRNCQLLSRVWVQF